MRGVNYYCRGAAQGQYPNLTPFSVSEIVASPVLTEVYRINDLQRFGKYEDFKDSMFVQQSNPDLDLLAFEYQALLADTKLSPVDRARIQDEFKNCLLYTSPSPRDRQKSRMPSS